MTVKKHMLKAFLFLLLVIFSSCSTVQYYIVRHAEKEGQVMGTGSTMTNDPPLSAAGKERAITLREVLKNKKISYIFSTNTIRTKTTAQPTAEYFGLKTETYGPLPDSVFIKKLGSLSKNVLIVGHSNTVDDVVNKLCGEKKIPGDLKDPEYDNLFVVKKKGKKMNFENKKFGVRTN